MEYTYGPSSQRGTIHYGNAPKDNNKYIGYSKTINTTTMIHNNRVAMTDDDDNIVANDDVNNGTNNHNDTVIEVHVDDYTTMNKTNKIVMTYPQNVPKS